MRSNRPSVSTTIYRTPPSDANGEIDCYSIGILNVTKAQANLLQRIARFIGASGNSDLSVTSNASMLRVERVVEPVRDDLNTDYDDLEESRRRELRTRAEIAAGMPRWARERTERLDMENAVAANLSRDAYDARMAVAKRLVERRPDGMPRDEMAVRNLAGLIRLTPAPGYDKREVYGETYFLKTTASIRESRVGSEFGAPLTLNTAMVNAYAELSNRMVSLAERSTILDELRRRIEAGEEAELMSGNGGTVNDAIERCIDKLSVPPNTVRTRFSGLDIPE